jgi:sugar O-acyltransferase (sialic acid O-acetyltransferase NeuD family)
MIEKHHIDYAVVAIGSNSVRRLISSRFSDVLSWPILVHPRACIAAGTLLGEGTVVFAGVVVQPDVRIGKHVILNTSCSIDHDSFISDYVHVAPGSHLAGSMTIEEGVFVGIGSSVIPGVTIGAWSVVGAGSTLIRDLPSNVTAIGTPAKVIRVREQGWQLD